MFGLGGARTHNQRLKRALLSRDKFLILRHLGLPRFLLLRLLLTILKKRPRRTVWLQRRLRLSAWAIPGFLPRRLPYRLASSKQSPEGRLAVAPTAAPATRSFLGRSTARNVERVLVEETENRCRLGPAYFEWLARPSQSPC
jgi:hypothetical protein